VYVTIPPDTSLISPRGSDCSICERSFSETKVTGVFASSIFGFPYIPNGAFELPSGTVGADNDPHFFRRPQHKYDDDDDPPAFFRFFVTLA